MEATDDISFRTVLHYMVELTPEMWVKYGGGVFIEDPTTEALVFTFNSSTDLGDLAAYIEKKKRIHLLATRAVIQRISRHISIKQVGQLIKILSILSPQQIKGDEVQKPGFFYVAYTVNLDFKAVISVCKDLMGTQITRSKVRDSVPKNMEAALEADYRKLSSIINLMIIRNCDSKSLCCGTPSACYICGAENAKFRCGQCLVVCYCNVDCQKAHWKLHKQLCRFCRNWAIYCQCTAIEFSQ